MQTLRLCLGGLDLLGQLGNGSEQISDKSVIRDLEDRSVGILIDGNDHLGLLHSCQMLNSTGNTYRHVQFWGDNLSSLTDLKRVVSVPSIDCCSRSSDGSSKRIS